MSQADLTAKLQHGLQLCHAGDFTSAESVYRDITASHPDAPDAWNMLAVILYQRDALEEAGPAAARATELRPQIAPYWLMRGNVELAQHRFAEAEASFTRAVALQPDFAEAQYRLGIAYKAQLRLPDALNAFRAALKGAPDVAEIHWQCGETLVALGRFEEAMRAYSEAFVRDPEGTLDRRNCFDCFGRLHFETLSPFWHAEIERFFSREDVDLAHYVNAGVKALKAQPAFRAALAGRDDAAGAGILKDRLFLALMRDCLIADPQFEALLTRLRARVLLDRDERARVPVQFLNALALQSFNNEYAQPIAPTESVAVDELQRVLETRLGSEGPLDDSDVRALLVAAAYRPLHRLNGAEKLLALEGRGDIRTLVERSIANVLEERGLRDTIEPIGAIDDRVSREVRGMYEENPYPRWFAIDREPPFTLAEWVQRELPAAPALSAPVNPRVLVAGCGSGHDAMWIAANLQGAQVLGVDLSLSSLAYATRIARKLGANNVRFRHGDILGLHTLEERFDLIASTGVLHHMREPAAGLRTLAKLLAPGGLMKIGLYSRRARHAVNAARSLIAQERIDAGESDIRAFRERVLACDPASPLWELRYSNDFYSTSMCRDLVFHVQEHQYTMPEIGALLEDAGLTLLGLCELPQEALDRYTRLFPEDTAMRDVQNWDRFEERYPDTFSNMFLFWCRAA